jgi:hypothetical protein
MERAKEGKCPACGSVQVEGGGVDVSGATADQHCQCNDCDATWWLVFKLSNVGDLLTAEEHQQRDAEFLSMKRYDNFKESRV